MDWSAGSHLLLPPWPRTVCPRFALQTVFLNCISAFLSCIFVFPTFFLIQTPASSSPLAWDNMPSPFLFRVYFCISLLYFYISKLYFYISNSDFNLFPTLTSECPPLFAFKTPATFQFLSKRDNSFWQNHAQHYDGFACKCTFSKGHSNIPIKYNSSRSFFEGSLKGINI